MTVHTEGLRTGCEAGGSTRRLRVDIERGRFQLDDQPVRSVERRWLLRRLLVALARARAAAPGQPLGTRALITAGWPDERILPRAARNRLHVALHRLRRLGLTSVLRCASGGWLVASDVALELRERDGSVVEAPAIAVSAREAFSW